jgi:hypothetical protein
MVILSMSFTLTPQYTTPWCKTFPWWDAKEL